MSISEAKRLIKQKAVEINGIIITNPKTLTKVGDKIKIGKRIFGVVVKSKI